MYHYTVLATPLITKFKLLNGLTYLSDLSAFMVASNESDSIGISHLVKSRKIHQYDTHVQATGLRYSEYEKKF